MTFVFRNWPCQSSGFILPVTNCAGADQSKASPSLSHTPTIVVSLSRPQTPGALPSSPPDVTSVTPSRDVATRAWRNTNQVGRIQTPRLRIRVAVNPVNSATTFGFRKSPSAWLFSCSLPATPASPSPKTPS